MLEIIQEMKEPERDESSVLQLPCEGNPSSSAQQRLWFVDQLQPGNPAYHIPVALRLTGQIDVRVAERSLREIVRRHEALRTVFRTVNGQVIQVVLPEVPCALPVDDLSHLAPADREVETARRMAAEFRRPFDLERGPLLRAGLLRLAPEIHVMWLAVHHIACDGWSIEVLFQDFAALYAAFLHGQQSPLPALPIRYSDYAVSQRTRLQGEALRNHLTFWKKQLDGLAETLELPADRPRPAEPAFRGGQRLFSLSPALTDALESLGKTEVVWPFMTLLAGFQALLQRYTGQNDIAVGTPVADRPRRDLHRMIGCFINVVVLRTDLSGNPSFRELLRRVRAMALRSYGHQELPFERLVEELRQAHAPGRQPLFQVMFTLQNDPTKDMALPGIEINPIVAVDCGASQYDLRLTMTRKKAGLDGALEYDSDLFDAATIDRIIVHFKVLLEAAVADPDRRLSELPLLTDAERQQMLGAWNDTRVEYPRDQGVHELFEEQVARSPAAVALGSGEMALTYAELNRRANCLAFRLRALGVRPESLVGLCAERSPDMVVGLLGILKAGGAYVPIDPDLPEARFRLMLDNARVSVLVITPGLRERMAALGVSTVLEVSGEMDPTPIGENNPERAASAEDLAYVIYTSGSTGVPKGVQVTHRALTNFLCSMRTLFPMTGGDTLLAVTTLSFDIAGLEIYLPLIQGARVELVGRDDTVDGARLAGRLLESRATYLQATPATWRLLLDAGWQGIPNLTMLCGGEAMPRDLAKRLLDKGAALWNLYGPTGTTIWSSAARVETEDGPVTIGRPIANTQLYVLDDHFQPVPVGVVGELWIGGDGVARGYLGQLQLTAERFVADPFVATPGARLYRTGDRVRYRPDGHIEFLGRADYQVKIRGFRVEPGDIETALRRHDGVRQVVVIVVDDRLGNKSLAAYVVAQPGHQPAPQDLRTFLKERLPAYMVPSHFVLLDSLPLTFSGKIDRRRLPDVKQIEPVSREEKAADSISPTERVVIEVYQDLLRVDRVLPQDTFVDLGGHSLQVLTAIARLESRLGVRLTPRDVLVQTIGQLAATFESQAVATPGLFPQILPNHREDGGWASLYGVKLTGDRPPLVEVNAFYSYVVPHLDGDQPYYALHTATALDERIPPFHPCTSIEDIVARYLKVLRVFQPAGPYFLIGWCFGARLAYEMAQHLIRQGEQVAYLGVIDWFPFDIPLELRLSERTHQFQKLGWRDRLNLIAGLLKRKAWWLLEEPIKLATSMKNMAECTIRRFMRIPLSPRLLQWRRNRVIRKVSRAHKLRKYPGKITLFYCSEAPVGGLKLWTQMAADVEAFEIGGTHLTMVEEPHARELAEALNTSLRKAQGTKNSDRVKNELAR